MLSLIEQEAVDLETNEMLQDEVAALEQLDMPSDTDFEYAKFQFKQKHDGFRQVLAKKQAMFMELVLTVESLVALNDQQVRNEAEKMQI